jgi:hypothetical protein
MNQHDLLINQALQDGWVRGHAWQAELRRVAIADARFAGEYAELQESISFIDLPRPDAWRIRVATGRMCVLEFLEVEVTSGVGAAKDELYRYLWDIFDATHYYHLRIWHMDRFGVVRPYITESTFDPMVFGMNVGWRS